MNKFRPKSGIHVFVYYLFPLAGGALGFVCAVSYGRGRRRWWRSGCCCSRRGRRRRSKLGTVAGRSGSSLRRLLHVQLGQRQLSKRDIALAAQWRRRWRRSGSAGTSDSCSCTPRIVAILQRPHGGLRIPVSIRFSSEAAHLHTGGYIASNQH